MSSQKFQEKSFPSEIDLNTIRHVAKRSIAFNFLIRTRDIIASAVGLLILSPLFLLVAILIKRDSPGPVFFQGVRSGKNGKAFQILKFRTMNDIPGNDQGAKITAENDPRITRVGHWLRSTKINELPQLWNVFIGEMSLVGPRPEDPDIVKTWAEHVQNEILSICPGITSPASVLFRDEESMLSTDFLMETYLASIQPSKMRLDQLYVRHRSFWVDIDILLWTFLALLPGLSKSKPPERLLYGGYISRGAHYIRRWFIIDFFVALIAVSTSAIFWRTFGPINIGFWAGVVEAIEFAAIFTLIGAIFGVQKIHWAKASPADILELFVSSAVATLVLLVANQITHKLPATLLISSAMIAFLGLVIARYRARVITGLASRYLRLRRSSDIYRERVLIIGCGDAGSYAAWLLSNSREGMRFNIVGYLDDDFYKHGIKYRGVRVLGSTKDIEKTTFDYDVGIILFAIHNIDEDMRTKILKKCEATEARTIIFPNIIGNISEALQLNEKFKEGQGQKIIQTPYVLKESPGTKNSALSVSQREKMQVILEELEGNLAEAEIGSCFEKVALLRKLINNTNEKITYEH